MMAGKPPLLLTLLDRQITTYRDMWFFRFWRIFVKGSWSHLSLVLQASFNIFFTATEEMSILSHAAQHWPKVINWRFYKKSSAPNVLGYIVADAKQWQVTKKFIFQRVKTACNSNENDDKKALCFFFNEANVPCIHNCFVFDKKTRSVTLEQSKWWWCHEFIKLGSPE